MVRLSFWSARLSIVFATALLAACGGGSGSDTSVSGGLDSGAATAVSSPRSQSMSSESDILDEWAKYAESGLPLDPSADPDPVESMIGRSARINRETIERANRERQAMGAKATFSYENPTDVYRFFNRRTAAHFYTVNQVERDLIIATMPDFVYEGPAFMVASTMFAVSSGESFN